MTKQVTKTYEVNTQKEAKDKLRAELYNWTWLNLSAKEQIVSDATFERFDTKYGPVYQIRFQEPRNV